MAKKKKKVELYNGDCIKGHYHQCPMSTGICNYCKRQITEPDPEWANKMNQVNKIVFGN